MPATLAVSLGIALLTLSGCAGPPSINSVRDGIREAIGGGDVMSVAFSVSRRGEVLWEEAYGLADAEGNVAATAGTPYSLASVSKPITATALMILVERGLVDLDRPVNDYLGDARLQGRAGDAAEATVRRVAAHYAGLPLHYQFFLANEDFPRPDMEETIRRYGVLVTKPGQHYQYSNLGYGVLEYLIERVSGRPYGEFLREEIFGPLGMNHSSAPVNAAPEGAAVRYWDKDTPLPFYDFDHRGASAVFASARDLTRFGMFHLGLEALGAGQPLRTSTIEEMREPVARIDENRGYGIGWGINNDRSGYRTVSHTGGMGGVATTLILVPDEQITVAVVSNSRGGVVGRVADELLAALLPEFDHGGQGRPQEQEGLPPEVGERLKGEWRGEVHTWAGQRTLRLWFAPGEASRAQLGDQPVARVQQLDYDDDLFHGVFDGDIGTPDASRREHRLRFKLALEGDRLRGSLTAVGKPTPKLPNALSYWTELARDPDRPPRAESGQ